MQAKHASELTINGKDKDSLKFANDFQEKSQNCKKPLRAANQEVQKAAEALGAKILPISLLFPINIGGIGNIDTTLPNPKSG